MKKESLIVRAVKWAARNFDVELADEAPGALETTPKSNTAPANAAENPGLLGANKKFEAWKDIDPFPDIAPSLLNAADIDDYMRATAMVFPYDSSKRKTASYPLSVGDQIAFWDANDPKEAPIRKLGLSEKVIIPSNSLIYVQTTELFQLPNYMAVRFNLHIDLVHKGLLLGTGPLVDPGFTGKLMVPLHNLTSNTYVLQVGDDFIWAEFTKTSIVDEWIADGPERPARSGSLVRFESRKTNKSLSDYVASAQKGHRVFQPGVSYRSLQNAIPDAIARTRRKAGQAKRSAATASAKVTFLTGVGLLAIVGTAATMVSHLISTRSALQSTLGLVATTNTKVDDQAIKIDRLETQIQYLRERVQEEAQRNDQSQSGGAVSNEPPRPGKPNL